VFNRGAFNRTAFNREFSVFVYANATMDGDGGMTVTGNMEFFPAATMDGSGSMTAAPIRELYFTATMDGIGEMSAAAIRDRFGSAIMNAVGELSANGSRFRVEQIIITGLFAPGDFIVIDSKNLLLTHNGANALHEMEGDFFELVLGDNVIKYQDTAADRSVLIRFTHRDKFV
jgi:hypothetical protein